MEYKTFLKFKIISVFIVFLSLFIEATGVFAQSEDFRLWMEAYAIKKMEQNEFLIFSEFYTKDNNHSIDRISIGAEGYQNLFPFMNIGVGYLLMDNKKETFYEIRHRFYTCTNFNWSVNNFKFSLRERYQATIYPEKVNENTRIFNYWRNRLKIVYIIPSCFIKPKLSIETFVLLNQTESKRLDEVRYSLAALCKVSDTSEIEFYGLLAKLPGLNQYILGLSYFLSI